MSERREPEPSAGAPPTRGGLPPSISREPARRARLLDDLERARQVDHPGIVALREVEDREGSLRLVWNDAAAVPLDVYLAERGALEAAEALRLGVELASAIAAAHRMGLPHGRLDVQRVGVREDGRVQVRELGLVELTRDHGDGATVRDDVAAIGALVRAMLAGRVDAPLPASAPEALVRVVERAERAREDGSLADADALLAELDAVDLPQPDVGAAVEASRQDVRRGTSFVWVLGTSLALAAIAAFVLSLLVGGR